MEDSFHLGVKALISNDQGEILLLQVNVKQLTATKKAYWDLPGGRVQVGDSIPDTLRREVAEETGITELTTHRPLGMVLSNIRIPLRDSGSVGLILSIYHCSFPRQSDVVLSEEHVASEWVSPQEAAARLAVKYPQEFCDLIAGASYAEV